MKESMIDFIKSISLKGVDEKFNNLKNQFIEMGQLKSEFDIEKFTIRKEGNFIAHNFHFLMRQYQFALFELRRMLLDKEEKTRRLNEYIDMKENKNVDTITVTVSMPERKSAIEEKRYLDIEIKRLQNAIDSEDINMTNQACMVEHFEKCRQFLIKQNNGNAPTNEQYQKEEPLYWKWFVMKKALQQFKQRETGITEGIWEAIDHIEENPVINNEYQVEIGSKFVIKEVEDFLANCRKEIKLIEKG